MNIEKKIHKKNLFNKNLYNFFHKHQRKLPWRDKIDGYTVLVSEFMLQQTQVNRVIPFYIHFLKTFPSINILAKATLDQVLRAWNGLGYNRRAKYLLDAAIHIVDKHNGIIPHKYSDLITLKGIGEGTAMAIITYTYNQKNIFVETNIRSVFLLFYQNYFKKKLTKIDDTEIKILVNYYCDNNNPRQWYYAMMDFGTFLKKKFKDKHIQKSKHFTKQSKFENSLRQLRGKIITFILSHHSSHITTNTLKDQFQDTQLYNALHSLIKDNLLFFNSNTDSYYISQ